MSRTPAIVLQGFFIVQPSGWALPVDPESYWGKFLLPIATQWSATEANLEAMLPEVDPRAAVNLLPDYERVLGPDPCYRSSLNITQQQRLTYQRWTARGGQSIGFFLSIAASLGITATIREGFVSRSGALRAGQRLGAAGNQFNWQMSLPTSVVTRFRAGASRAGERLGQFQPSLVECAVRQFSPAHTDVTFNYTGIA